MFVELDRLPQLDIERFRIEMLAQVVDSLTDAGVIKANTPDGGTAAGHPVALDEVVSGFPCCCLENFEMLGKPVKDSPGNITHYRLTRILRPDWS